MAGLAGLSRLSRLSARRFPHRAKSIVYIGKKERFVNKPSYRFVNEGEWRIVKSMNTEDLEKGVMIPMIRVAGLTIDA